MNSTIKGYLQKLHNDLGTLQEPGNSREETRHPSSNSTKPDQNHRIERKDERRRRISREKI